MAKFALCRVHDHNLVLQCMLAMGIAAQSCQVFRFRRETPEFRNIPVEASVFLYLWKRTKFLCKFTGLKRLHWHKRSISCVAQILLVDEMVQQQQQQQKNKQLHIH